MATKVHGRCYTNKREVRSMKLKMFLSDYQYRQMILKEVAMKITELKFRWLGVLCKAAPD